MDPAGVGALIGIGVMACVFFTFVIREKGADCMNKLRETYQKYKNQRQPLLPVSKENPLLVRTSSKQFQMKEILPSK